jgi:hypothetical protein
MTCKKRDSFFLYFKLNFKKELKEQSKKIQFDIFMKLFSILRYLIDNLAK